jgi:hypothetical protein
MRQNKQAMTKIKEKVIQQGHLLLFRKRTLPAFLIVTNRKSCVDITKKVVKFI